MSTANSILGLPLNLGAPLPLIIGISGHKNAILNSSSQSLEALVREKLRELKAATADKGFPGLLVLTGLAEGADQIIARAAQAESIPYVATLPMAREAYLDEFQTALLRTDFETLLQDAAWVVELPLPPGVDISQVRLGAGPEPQERQAQYVALGALLTSTCDVLIALWDGQPFQPGTVGGTGHVVHLMRDSSACLQQGRLIERPLEHPEPRVVLHLKVSRVGKPPVTGEGQWTELFGYDATPHTALAQMLAAMQKERSGAPSAGELRLLDKPRIRSQTAQSLNYLLPETERASIRAEHPGLDQLLQAYAQSDTLAQVYQRRMKRYLAVLLFLGVTAALSGSIYSDFNGSEALQTGMLMGFFALLFLGVLLVWLKRGKLFKWPLKADTERRYEDYRALAEGLRVQAFWHLGNVHDSAADHTLAHQRCGLGWVKIYLRLLHLRAMATQVSGKQSLVTQRWVDDQAGWFKNKTDAAKKDAALFTWASRFLFYAGLVCGAVLLWHAFAPFERCFLLDSGLLKVCLGFLPVAAGVVKFYLEFSGKENLATQYERMSLIFKRAQSHLRRATPAQVPFILFELGRKALDENGTWLLMNREREVKLPD
jgi:hypothetical protein